METEQLIIELLDKAGHAMCDSDYFFVLNCQGNEHSLGDTEIEMLQSIYERLV